MAVVYLFNGFPIFAVRRLPVLRNHNPRRRGVGVAFMCPFCKRDHEHAMPLEGFGDKPRWRAANCGMSSPFWPGYYIVEEDKANPGALPQKWAAVLETADVHRRNESPLPEGMLPLGDVRAFIKAKNADARVGRSDALCWAYTGRRGVKLRTQEIESKLFTTPQWVAEFMRAAGFAAA